MPIPHMFCWTRFGTEAGEGIDRILVRKEEERLANHGVFLWGIGNAIGPSIRELVRRDSKPTVVFSPIRSNPRNEDVAPNRVVRWRAGRTLGGQQYELPAGSVVTSGVSGRNGHPKHYALVCFLASALRITDATENVPFKRLRNLLSERMVGASQVTAVVRCTQDVDDCDGKMYPAAIQADLVFPYFIELTDPIPWRSNFETGAVSSNERRLIQGTLFRP